MAKSNEQRRRRGRSRNPRGKGGQESRRDGGRNDAQKGSRTRDTDPQSLLPKRSSSRSRAALERNRKRFGSLSEGVPDEVKYRMPDPPPKRDYGNCPICDQPMRDIHSAIAFPPSNRPAHFDCVVRTITENESLGDRERVCYLGNGSFGIVEDRGHGGQKSVVPVRKDSDESDSSMPVDTSRYLIRKRIQYEEKDLVLEWRRELSPGISRE